MHASTKSDNEKIVSVRGRAPPILKCYLVSVSNKHTAKQPSLETFLSPPVLMHGGLLGVAFCLSVCLSGCHYTKIH